MKRVLFAAAACLVLASCATDGVSPSQPGSVVAVSQKAAEVAYAAESAWKGALLLTEAAVDSGALKGEQAKQVSAILAQAKSKRDTAWALYDAGNAAAATPLFNQVLGLVGSIGSRSPVPK